MCSLNEEDAEKLEEVMFVKILHPGEFIFDVLPDDIDLQEEVFEAERDEERLTGYFRNRSKETLDGRTFAVGETVAVKLKSSWRPAMCTELKHCRGSFTYELLLLDSGQIIQEDFVNFRPLPFLLNSLSRFNAFALLDILPIGMQKGLCRWEADAEEDVRFLMQLASKILIVTKASYPLSCYKRLFGNVFLHMQTEIIDLKQRLVAKGWAFENASLFRRVYQLSDEHFYDWKPEDLPAEKNMMSPGASNILSQSRLVEITDSKLDEFLPDCWKTGGSDPVPQTEREKIRRMVMGEACIGFGMAVRGYQRVVAEESLKREIRQSRTQQECRGGSSDPRSFANSSVESERNYSSCSEDSFSKKGDVSEESQTEEESDDDCRGSSSDVPESKEEESWTHRNQIHRQFGGENSRLMKLNVGRTGEARFVSPSKKTVFAPTLTDEMRNRILPFFKSVANDSPVRNESVRSDEDTQSDSAGASSSSGHNGAGGGVRLSPFSVKASENELSVETKRKVLALIKGSP